MIVGFIYMKMISCRSKIIVFLLFFYINTVAGVDVAESSVVVSENERDKEILNPSLRFDLATAGTQVSAVAPEVLWPTGQDDKKGQEDTAFAQGFGVHGKISEKKKSIEPSEDKLSSFYSDYISKYYPRAYVIRGKFMRMTAEQVADALNDIVHVFTKEPWFYFQNAPKGFRLIHYWEYVLDQCAIIHDFLSRAKVDLKTKKIIFQQNFYRYDYAAYFDSDGSYAQKTQNLLDYLKKNHMDSYTAFFSLAFDYEIKFFNEGILLKNLGQANKYYSEIGYVFEKLGDTPKEEYYHTAARHCKQLLGILKKRLGIDKLDNMERGVGVNAAPEVNGIDNGTSSDASYYKEFTELNDVI